jgi:hypothetical protein
MEVYGITSVFGPKMDQVAARAIKAHARPSWGEPEAVQLKLNAGICCRGDKW